jgi:hypothetical protein
VAKARRAKRSAARFVVPIVIALVLLAGGLVAGWQYLPLGWLSASPRTSPSVAATESTAAPTSASSTSASPSASSSETPSPTPTQDPNAVKARQALDACRVKVDAGDEVISAAKTGIGHWAGHVDAQRQADLGNIGLEEMTKRFKATRLKGPGDQKRYQDALKSYDKQRDASCDKVAKAPRKIAATLAKCATRSDDQRPVLTAGAAGMKDWAAHLAAMQRNKIQHLANAQQTWVKAYRAAPTNINAFNRALKDYDPPSC